MPPVRYGLEYVGKGAKFPGTGSDFSINLNYLEIPVTAVYHYPVGPGQIQAVRCRINVGYQIGRLFGKK